MKLLQYLVNFQNAKSVSPNAKLPFEFLITNGKESLSNCSPKHLNSNALPSSCNPYLKLNA